MIDSLFGFDVPGYIIIAILVVNFILAVLAFVGFRNLKRQINDLKSILEKIKAKQKEIRE
jgi:ABC-type nitrate/sulfonate/bicarbonate transport system permease component